MSRSGLSTKSGAQQIASSMRPEDEHISGWKERGEPFPPYAGVDEMFGDEDRP
jgi:hypothetical protein